MVLPLQLTAPSTARSSSSAADALSMSTVSLNTTSRLVVMRARCASSASGCVRRTSRTAGGRASTVLATYSSPERTSPPAPMTTRLRRRMDRICGRSAMPEARRKDLELVAVLGDRAARERDAVLGQGIGDLLVRERMPGILGLDHALDLVLDPQRCGEEVAERHHLTRRDHHVLLRCRAAHRRLVHADQLADLGAREGDEVLHALQQV